MWLMLAMVCFVLWLLAVGLFHVTGNSIHLLAVVAMISVASHFVRRRRKLA